MIVYSYHVKHEHIEREREKAKKGIKYLMHSNLVHPSLTQQM